LAWVERLGEIALKLDPINLKLRDSLGNALAILARRAHQKNLELACDYCEGTFPKNLSVIQVVFARSSLIILSATQSKFTQIGEVGVAIRMESRDTTW
jgi:signal transduction histidine kinase